MGFADKFTLHIPYPAWAKDGDVRDDRDFENWKELQRWADRLVSSEDDRIVEAEPQLLCMHASTDSIISGGDHIVFDSIVASYGFDGVTSAGLSWIHPVSGIYVLTYEHAWTSYTGGGTIELELNGTVIPEGTIASGSSGQTGNGTIMYAATEGDVGSIKITQSSGSSQTCEAFMRVAISDPADGPLGIYAAAVLADGPVAYWRLDEGSGTSASDATGNGHTGTYNGSPTLGATGVMLDGSGSTSVDFDGSNDWVTGLDWADVEFAGTAEFSIEAWINHDGKGGLQGIAVKTYSYGSGDNDGWSFYLDGTTVGLSRSNRTTNHAATTTLTASTTAYIAGTYDGTTIRLYKDGALVAADATALSIPANTGVLVIGNGNKLSGPDTGLGAKKFDGRIDEVAIYDRVLTPAEIAEHYSIGILGA